VVGSQFFLEALSLTADPGRYMERLLLDIGKIALSVVNPGPHN